jgi:hypothetical protein
LGRSVQLWKVEDSESSATYHYGPDPNRIGRLTINKVDGTVSSEPVANMSPSESWFFYGMLATAAAERFWHRNSYPPESSLSS